MQLILYFLIILVSVSVTGFARTIQPEHARILLLGLSTLQIIVGGLWYYLVAGRVPFAVRVRPRAAQRATVVLVFLLMTLLVMGLTEPAGNPVPIRGEQFLWLTFYYLIMISLAEELICRGIPYLILPSKSLSALLVSSASFSLLHLNNGLPVLPYFFAMGLVFGILRHFGVPLLWLVMGHGAFNLALNVFWQAETFRFGEQNFYIVAPFVLVALAMMAGWLLSSFPVATVSPSQPGGPMNGFSPASSSPPPLNDDEAVSEGMGRWPRLKAAIPAGVRFRTSPRPEGGDG